MECENAEQAWELLRVLREDCLVWQCGSCDGWIFTSNRPRVGVLRCSTCGQPGVDFRHEVVPGLVELEVAVPRLTPALR